MMKNWLYVLLVTPLATSAWGQDPLAAIVRTTEPLAPQEQLRKFHLPEGFEIQLFAAEPDIQKPMNMAFDAQGRLWVSGSVEYPFAAQEGRGRDSIRVLSDADGDGRADQITTFVEGLNIPIGLYPYRDGVVAYSIPSISFFRDTDGDGRCDHQEVLYGPLGDPVDTHGMQNAFRRGFDGWLYVCHGFRNASVIRGRDGSQVKLESGNTYRVRLDGSRVEQFTWGQVNPFGSTFTPWGDLITADCHSLPLSLLLRGGYYSSFGKPDDGLGFVPPVMRHSHGSTAISGAAIYAANQFPEPYRGSLFVGNVMTSRVHRDALVWHGSTLEAREEADFLTCDDPWFRPVDLQVGPDGALYIADFYNRIIGHYEVPLEHPQRDRERGRIWRVVYRGHQPTGDDTPGNLALAEARQLIAALASDSFTQRQLATDQLSDRVGPAGVEPLRAALASGQPPLAQVHALWVLHRLGAVAAAELAEAARHPDELVRVHAMRLLSESPAWNAEYRGLAVAGLRDESPLVRRCAADVLGQHPDATVILPLLEASASVDEADVHLRHAIRLALRNQLRQGGAFADLPPLALEMRRELARVALAVPSEASAQFVIAAMQDRIVEGSQLATALKHVARYTPAQRLDDVAELARSQAGGQIDFQVELIQLLQQQLLSRGLRGTPRVTEWGSELAERLLTPATSSWASLSPQNPWGLERRNCADGQQGVLFLSSLPGGERATGTLRSPTFEIPPRLSFYLCGHLGLPANAPLDGNRVRLRLEESGGMVQQALPPRNDVAQRVDWDLEEWSGRRGYLELVDGIDLDGYAWLAVARFEPPVVALPETAPHVAAQRLIAGATLAKSLKLSPLADRLRALIRAEATDESVRLAAAEAWLAIHPQPAGEALLSGLRETAIDAEMRRPWAMALAADEASEIESAVRGAMQVAPTRLQEQMAEHLAATTAGAELLLQLIESGKASPRLLQRPAVDRGLRGSKPRDAEARIARLTADLVPASEQLAALLDARVQGFARASASPARGADHFTKHCAACHQVAGKGTVIGPQLDGVGNRGLARVVEDLLDPNRNIDEAFHVTLLVTADGRVLTGLFRRDEAQSKVYAGKDGKEFALLAEEIAEERKSRASIMPDNFGTVLSEAECYDLLAYLMSLRAQPSTPPEPASSR